MQAARRSDVLPGAVWFTRAAGQVWGPYPETRLALFVQEGRIDGATPLAPTPHGPFEAAGAPSRLPALFAPPLAEPRPPERRTALRLADAPARPESARSEPLQPEPARAESPLMIGRTRPMLVFAALASLPASRFEAALAAYGEHRAVQPGVWLVRARLGPAALRNALSRRLRGEDALLVVEAPLDQTAWFNLPPPAERDLRRVWSGEG